MKRTFARLLGLPTLIVLVSVMVTLMVGRAAVAQTPDETAKRFNYLPLVADGEGIQSTLLITNVADSSNQCSLVFLANQLDANDFETHDQLSLGGAGAAVDLPSSGSHVSIVSKNGPVLALDSATLDCAEPVVARVLISLSAGGTVQTAATLPSAETGAKFSFPVIPRVGGNFLIAYNQHSSEVNCRVELADESGIVVDERSHTFPGSAAIVRNLADLVQAPANFVDGSATTSCDKQIAATGLLLGVALSELPPVVLSRQPTVITPTAPDLVVDSASVSDDTLETGQSFNLRRHGSQQRRWPGRKHDVALLPLHELNDLAERYAGRHGCRGSSWNAGDEPGVDLSDGAVNRWRVLLRRLRGQRVRRKRHGQQLFERHTRHGVVRDDESADRGTARVSR